MNPSPFARRPSKHPLRAESDAGIQPDLRGVSPVTPTIELPPSELQAGFQPASMHVSPATKLPLELVEIIIGYLAFDARALLACVLVCHSWYTAAARHLHHDLIVRVDHGVRNGGSPPPSRVLPLVKSLDIRGPTTTAWGFRQCYSTSGPCTNFAH